MKFVDGFGQACLSLDNPIELVFQKLRIEELFPVFPFVKGLRLVKPFIALKPDQRNTHEGGGCFGKFRLTHACGSLHEHRLTQLESQVYRMGNLFGGNVAYIFETLADPLNSDKFIGQFAHCSPFLR